jgi:hypothetical protein
MRCAPGMGLASNPMLALSATTRSISCGVAPRCMTISTSSRMPGPAVARDGDIAIVAGRHDGANVDAKRLKAEALTQLGERQISANARNFYLSSAQYLLRDLPAR